MAQILLGNGADIDIQNNDYDTPLHYAVSKMHLNVAKLLIAYGANVNLLEERGRSALSIAHVNDQTEMIHLLVAHGATIPNYNLIVHPTLQRETISIDDVRMVLGDFSQSTKASPAYD